MKLDDVADLDAERCLAAIVVETAAGAALAVDHGVSAEDFTHPGLGRLFAAAIRIGGLRSSNQRVERAAELAGVDLDWTRDVVATERKAALDTSGAYARRVKESAQRWREVHSCLQRLEDLGVKVAV